MYIHDIDPVALHFGVVNVHWYGVMYLVSFLAIWLFLRQRLARYPHLRITTTQLTDFITVYIVIGVVVGGRVGYVLMYGTKQFLHDPLFLFKIWEGGMSFHGGFIGVIIATMLFAKRHGIHTIDLLDFGLVATPIGLFFGRIGNFIGGELWGAPTSLPWGVIFPRAGDMPRHPSQLYEAFFEGLVLWILLWWLSHKPRPRMFVSSLFCIGYAIARISIECIREPDSHIGYLAFDFVTMGMVLSIPILLVGIVGLIIALRQNIIPHNNTPTNQTIATYKKHNTPSVPNISHQTKHRKRKRKK